MSLRKIYEKFDVAILALMCNDTSLHDRLDIAIVEVTSLAEKDIAPDIRQEFIQLVAMIHAYRKSGNEPAMQSGIATAIFEIYKKLISETGLVNKK